MFEAQFSLVICGSHEARWVAYAFDDTEVDEEDLCDRISVCDGFHPDPILDDETDADCPIWNPREYFLRTLANRITRGTNSWDALVRAIDRSIGEYVSGHAYNFSTIFLSTVLTAAAESSAPFYFGTTPG